MLIPWGHDSSQLRRRPWVTYGLALACLVAFVATERLSDPRWLEAETRLDAAFGYWQDHPYLEGNDRLVRAYGALDEGDYARWEEATGGLRPGQRALEREQARLDALTDEVRQLLGSHPWYAFGLVPSAPTAQGMLGHMFLHLGWLHLLGNLWFLILAGPYIEDRFGRGLFVTFYLASGFTGAAFFAATQGGLDAPLIGASGAVSGILGAFLVCCLRVRIKFFYWVIWPGTFAAPAWIMLPLWFGSELLSAFSAGDGSPVAYWAHVGGFAFGATAALLIRQTGLEARLSSDLGQLDLESGSPVLDATRKAIQDGQLEEAIAVSNEGLADGNADPAAVKAYLEAVHAAGRQRDVVPTLIEHLWSAIEWRKKEAAIALWDALAAQKVAPSGRGEPLLQLAGWLRGADRGAEAGVALREALAGADDTLAVRIARAARRKDPLLVKRAAEQALASPDLASADRKAMQALCQEAVQEAGRRGWILLPAEDRVEKGRGRDVPRVVPSPAASSAAPQVGSATSYEDEILGDADSSPAASPAGDAEGLDLFDATATAIDPDTGGFEEMTGVTRAPSEVPSSSSPPSALAPGEAIDISDILGEDDEPPVRLPDPETAGGEAFLDSLHESLEAEGLSDRDLLEESAGELTDEPEAPDLGNDAAAMFGDGKEDLSGNPDARDSGASDPSSEVWTLPEPPTLATPATASDRGSTDDDFAVPSDDFAVLDEEKDVELAPPRRLQVMSAVPLALDATHLTLDVEGRGRSRLAFDRIDAVSTAGVKGLSETGKPVLVIDLCLNWTGHDDLQVVRLRSDGFDPRKLVDAEGSPLKALRALAALLATRCHAVALPLDSGPDAAFKIFGDPSAYHLEVLSAVR